MSGETRQTLANIKAEFRAKVELPVLHGWEYSSREDAEFVIKHVSDFINYLKEFDKLEEDQVETLGLFVSEECPVQDKFGK